MRKMKFKSDKQRKAVMAKIRMDKQLNHLDVCDTRYAEIKSRTLTGNIKIGYGKKTITIDKETVFGIRKPKKGDILVEQVRWDYDRNAPRIFRKVIRIKD